MDKKNKISSFSILPKKHSLENIEKRKKWVKKQTNVEWDDNEKNQPEEFEGILENHLGFINMPLGIALPLLIKEASYAKGEYVVPIVTLEGTLVASMSRGMLASYRSGGVSTTHLKQAVSRAPIFILPSPREIPNFIAWVEKEFENIKKICAETTNYGTLLKIETFPLHNNVVLDFIFSTGNAAGQNMVSLSTLKGCEYIQAKTKKRFYLESNFSGDKKYSQLNVARGRGHYIIAETILTTSVLKRVLGCEIESFYEMSNLGMQSSTFSGTAGLQLHLANALTGIYLATGQDVACVAENSIGFTNVTKIKEGLHISLTMPSLTIGTVGGGTRLAQQRKNLTMLGCVDHDDSAKKLAEIIGASALCLEMSLLAAIVSGGWVRAHMRYGRQQK